MTKFTRVGVIRRRIIKNGRNSFINGQNIALTDTAKRKLKAGIEAAIRVQTSEVTAIRAIVAGEDAADEHLPIGLERDGIDIVV